MTLSTRKLIVEIAPKTFLIAIAFGVGLWVLLTIREAICLVFIAALIASALYPVAKGLHRKFKLPFPLCIILLYLGFALLAVGFSLLVGNIIITEGSSFINALPLLTQQSLRQLSRLLPALNDQMPRLFAMHMEQMASHVSEVFTSAIGYVFTALQAILAVISILVLVFFMLMEPHAIETAVLRLVPAANRERLSRFFHSCCEKLGAYVRGQLFVAACVGLVIGLGLYIMDVPYAFILGILTFVLDLIPILGSLSAALFGILLALGHGLMAGVWVAILYLVVNQLEANVFSPWIVGRAVGLKPFWIIISLLVGGLLSGTLGVLLAIPSAVILQLALDEFFPPVKHPY